MGAGPTTGSGIARVLADPQRGNMAVALLSRSGDEALAERLGRESQGGILKAFATDTSPEKLGETIARVRKWAEEKEELKLKLAVWNIKHSHRVAFEDEDLIRFGDSLQTYVTGAAAFSQFCLKWMLSQYDGEEEEEGGGGGDPDLETNHDTGETVARKKGTLIFTGTLGALRTNPGYAAYGAGRAGVRMLAQSLAREYSSRGVHVVHAIANGGVVDVDTSLEEEVQGQELQDKKEKVRMGQNIRAESVGRLYLALSRQSNDLWVHELDMRPAKEKF